MKRALVLDDAKNIRILLTTCLEINGYSVVALNNGFDAIAVLQKESFDFIFLDIKMPEISGTEVLRRIREMGINTPVVIMTAFATVKNAVECTKLGAVSYLQKPFTAEKIKSILNDIEKYLNGESHIDFNISKYIEESKLLIKNNRPEEALEILKKALSIDPTIWTIYYLMGLAYEKIGNSDLSQDFYNAAKCFEKTH